MPKSAQPPAGWKRIDTPKGHYYTHDGRRAVGVTTALNALPKPAIPYWYGRTVAEHVVDNLRTVSTMLAEGGRQPTIKYLAGLPEQKRDTAAERGTEVHELVVPLAEGKPVEVPAGIEPYVRGALMYLDDWQPTTVLAEAVVASNTHLYCGTLDSIQDVPRLGRVLVDWKTSNGIYGDHVLQVAAYRYADVFLDADGREHPMIPVEDTYILHIKPDDYELVPVVAGPEQFERFVEVLTVYRNSVQSNKLSKLIGQPLPRPQAVAA
jgi:hypothetical protein